MVGKVVLNVSGISDTSGLTISYTKPATGGIQDQATVPNQSASFVDEPVSAATIKDNEIHVSSDRKYIRLELEKALYSKKGLSDTQFAIELKYGVAEDSGTVISASDYSILHSSYSNGSIMEYTLTLKDEAIPSIQDEGKYFVTLMPQANAKDFADDTPSTISFIGEPRSVASETMQPESVTYDGTQLKITFGAESGFMEYNVAGCMFTITQGGETYNIRGFAPVRTEGGKIVIKLNKDNLAFDTDTFNWSGATLSYSNSENITFSVFQQLSFSSSKPYTGFDSVAITTNP